MATTDVNITEFKGNATNLIKAVNQIDAASKNLDATLTSVLSHIQAIESGLKNVNHVTNNINSKKTDLAYNVGQQKHIVKGSTGFIGSETGRDKLYKEYAQAIIDETREITADIAERKRLREQRADAETTKANAEALRVSKIEDQNSSAYQERMRTLADARMLNAKNKQAGALLNNRKYQTGRALSGIGNTVSSMGVGGKIIGSVLDSIGVLVKSPIAGTATALVNLGKVIKDLGSDAVKAYAEIEATKTQLGIVYSSQTQANEAFGQISQYAVHSPFGIQQTSELAVLLKQSGVYASDLMDTLRMLGDTAGGNMEKMKRIANNYAQIMAIGKASMLDMRQFAYAGIPIFEAVSKELNVSQQELRKLISDGKVTSDIIEKVFKDLTGINGIFENATEIGAKTLKARLQNLADARQLAFASVGETIYKAGSKTGSDSFGERLLSWAEKIWQDIHEKVDTRNIEKSIKVIENRDLRINELNQLLQTAKDTGNKTLQYAVEKAIERELKKRDIEAERSTYASSYDVKMNNYDQVMQEFMSYGIPVIELYTRGFKELEGVANVISQGYSFEYLKENYGKEFAEYFEGWDKQMFTDFSDAIFEFKKAIQGRLSLTERERNAASERDLITAQQLAADEINKSADNVNSLNSSFQELTELYKASDEYQEKQEADRKKRLEEALVELKKIAENTEDGVVDVTKFSASQLSEYIKNGAFTTNRSLTVAETNKISEDQMTKDRTLLMKQYGYLFRDVLSEFKKSGNFGIKQGAYGFTEKSFKNLEEMTNADFFKNFHKYYNEQTALLKEAIKIATTKEQKEQLQTYLDLMPKMLHEIGFDDSGANANLADLDKAGKQFIPLWKRILAQYTGLSAETIKNTAETLGNYRNDMAVRSLASSVMTATAKSADVSSAMFLARPSNQLAKLQGGLDAVVQIDWKSTREAVKNFALQLSASTEVVSAYKNALEEEYNTMVSLLAAGYTTSESQDLKNQKWVSGNTYKRIIESTDSQLVNAFGNALRTTEGQEVWLHADGKFYDAAEGGREVLVENLVVTENLFDIIKQTLPEIQRDLHEANTRELQSKVLEEALNKVKATQLMGLSSDYSTPLQSQISSFLLNNSEYLSKAYDTAIKVARDNYKNEKGDYKEGYEFLEGLKDADLLTIALNGKEDDYSKAIRAIVKEALELVREETGSFVVSGENENSIYSILDKLGDNEEKNRILLNDIERINKYQRGVIDAYGRNSANPLNYPNRKRAYRNEFWSLMGFDMAYDKEDYLVQAAKSGLVEEKGRDFNRMANDNIIISSLEEAEKESLLIQKLWNDISETMENATKSLSTSLKDFAKGSFLVPFEALGKYLATGENQAENMGQAMKDLTAETLSAVGATMANTGLQIAGRAAMEGNWTVAAAGLALAASGGVASGLGSALREGENEKNKSSKEKEKLESLKDDLTKLLEQARKDALYYENNLRHKTALGTNERFSYQSVHDAVITPRGDVVTTDPKDYLIATKTPQQFVGGGNVTVSPVINCNVVNNTRAQVRQEQTQNADGSVDIVTIIEEVAGVYIASSRSDEAFGARNARMNGRQVVM